jgi:hypothetical protein
MIPRRKNLARSALPPRRAGIKRVSRKRSAKLSDYAQVKREAIAAAGGKRQANILGICTSVATEIHHRRGRDNDRLTDTKWFLPVCKSCHIEIHRNPAKSVASGFSVLRNDPIIPSPMAKQ